MAAKRCTKCGDLIRSPYLIAAAKCVLCDECFWHLESEGFTEHEEDQDDRDRAE